MTVRGWVLSLAIAAALASTGLMLIITADGNPLQIFLGAWLTVSFTTAFLWGAECAIHDARQHIRDRRILAGDPKAIRKLVQR